MEKIDTDYKHEELDKFRLNFSSRSTLTSFKGGGGGGQILPPDVISFSGNKPLAIELTSYP